ncbi:oxygen-dependent protoporphyrinogen oxidase [Aspergillus melleus]|uniref:oxygen-dependent protoporphyrinogen oxidase n=1 Tax=Aspergillus melleus TaxID=138277 RepID=UPI001E8CA0A7|nr:oxygen-dependent protoporphyrinogen oxidase [Aspergillus melleus]KAH8427832.1 oxygen-dependent protoporphyrinogen oxidase [Aspergillus melleus]
MRLPHASSHALKGSRLSLALARNGQRRSLHTPTYDAAVVGGGITGLTTAYRLSRDPKCSKITLYEKSKNVGGWLQSEKIPFKDGHVVFEYGPRTLRTALPSCLPLLDLLEELDLLGEVLVTSKTSAAALNRYIYYPDHLARVPAPDPARGALGNALSLMWSLFREPVFKSIFLGIYNDIQSPAPQKLKADESVGDFISRRLSPELADNLVSSVFHGIYAGDIYQLSAEALLGQHREPEGGVPSIMLRLINEARMNHTPELLDDQLAMELILEEKSRSYLNALAVLVRQASVLTLRNGLGQLTDALLAALAKSKKVDILPEAEVTAISRNQNSSNITISHGQDEHRMHNRVVSTIPAPHLAKALRQGGGEDKKLPHNTIQALEEHNYAVTVMVVNLFYEKEDLLPVKGFGYLIPRSIPFEQNPERGLGVIFGSETSAGQDTVPGTKLTVMLGGHLWDGWTESDYPDHDTAVKMARTLLERHLGITDAPAISRSRLHRNAIPQYTVGHPARMDRISESARADFSNRLSLAGSWYGGIGVVDCIRHAYLTAAYGVSAQKLRSGGQDRPWKLFNYTQWELEGGIVKSPVRLVWRRPDSKN